MFTAQKTETNLFVEAVPEANRGKCFSIRDMYGLKTAKAHISDAKVHDDNFTFLTSALSKLHNDLVSPIINTTWAKDVPAETGGGFVDYVEWYSVDWAGIMNEQRNIVGNGANYIPRVNAGMNQYRANVYTYEVAYDLRFIELEKFNKVKLQKSIQEIYKTAITAGWDYFVQNVAYTGINGSKGLFNSDKVPVSTITIPASTTGIDGLTDAQVVALFNGIIKTYLEESNMNGSIIPDTFLVPVNVYTNLVSRMSSLYTNNLLDFVLEHNMAKGVDGAAKITIQPRIALSNSDINSGNGRIVAYKKAKEFVRIDIPYPMQHYITLPNMERMAYTSAFVGQVSEVQLPYNPTSADFGPVTYWDLTPATEDDD